MALELQMTTDLFMLLVHTDLVCHFLYFIHDGKIVILLSSIFRQTSYTVSALKTCNALEKDIFIVMC